MMALAEETALDFSSRVTEQLVGGMVGIGIAMGMETGLFDVMISFGDHSKTSQEIADKVSMKERYVREWLGCMAAANIVNFDPVKETFWLPSHRSNIMELKALAMTVPVLNGGFFQVAECFRKDGPAGVSYNEYPKIDELWDKVHYPFFRDQFLQEFIPSMPTLNQKLIKGMSVLEVGCCAGGSCRMLASQYPNSHIYGLDICPNLIEEAREKIKRMDNMSNVEFVNEDVSCMPAEWTWKFDYVFMYFVLHDLSHPYKALREIHRVLKPGGTLSVVDTVTHTKLEDNLKDGDRAYVLTQYTMSLMNCLPVSLQSGDAGLGAMWGREKAQQMLQQADLEVVSVSATNAHLNGLHYMCKKPPNNSIHTNSFV